VLVRHTGSDRDAFSTQPAAGAFLSVMARVLRTLRFTSLDKRPARRLCDDGRRAGSVGSFFPEIKRSAASHSGKK
jgi:hypothetical protein